MALSVSTGNYYRASITDFTGNVPGSAFSLSVKGKPADTTSRYTAFSLFPGNNTSSHVNQNGAFFEFNGPSFGNSPCLYSGSTIDQGAGQSGKSWIDTTSHYTTGWNVGSAAFHGSGTNAEHGQTNGTLSTGASSVSIGMGLLCSKICVGASIPADNTGNDVPLQTFSGPLASLAVWTVLLTDRQQTALGASVSPRLVGRGNLFAYIPLVASCFNACYRSTIQTTGAPSLARHPRQYGW